MVGASKCREGESINRETSFFKRMSLSFVGKTFWVSLIQNILWSHTEFIIRELQRWGEKVRGLFWDVPWGKIQCKPSPCESCSEFKLSLCDAGVGVSQPALFHGNWSSPGLDKAGPICPVQQFCQSGSCWASKCCFNMQETVTMHNGIWDTAVQVIILVFFSWKAQMDTES